MRTIQVAFLFSPTENLAPEASSATATQNLDASMKFHMGLVIEWHLSTSTTDCEIGDEKPGKFSVYRGLYYLQ